MFRPSRRRVTILLLLALALVGPWTAAAQPGGSAERAAWQPWDLASRFWAAVIELWGESGCSVGPDGRCAGGTPTSATQSGCSLDPSGRCGQ
jgi:ABC-type sugar transport system substrate-binding protein